MFSTSNDSKKPQNTTTNFSAVPVSSEEKITEPKNEINESVYRFFNNLSAYRLNQYSSESAELEDDFIYGNFFNVISEATLAYFLKRSPLPETAQLKGDVLVGQFFNLFSEDGSGFHRIVMTGADEAAENEYSRAQWYFGPFKKILLVTDPKDIRKLLSKKSDGGYYTHFLSKDSTKIFEMFFGKDAIFNSTIDSKVFAEARAEFVGALLTPSNLDHYLETMWEIIDKHFTEIDANAEPVKLYETMNFIALDIISETQLGFKIFDDDLKKKVANKIAEAMSEAVNPITLMKAKIPLSTTFPFDHLILNKVARIRDETHALIRKMIEDNSDNILATDNFISRLIEKKKLSLDKNGKIIVTDEILHIVAQVLVAGHETTTKLLFFSLMILADPNHHEQLDNIYAEMKEYEDRNPMRSDLKNMSYLQAFMLEVLRLYPPIVHLLFEVETAFEFAGGELLPGDLVIISPGITHQLEKVYPNADQFDPERFLIDNHGKDDVIHPENYELFPFGFYFKKQCPGNKFARLEASAVIFYVLKHYLLTASHTVDPKTSYRQVAAMKVSDELENEATITFERIQPRSALCLKNSI